MDSPGGISSPLKTSQAFLAHRNFDQCVKYAMKGFQTDPTNPLTPRLLAIANTLAAATRSGPPDWYSIVGLPSSTNDPATIRARVDLMKDLMDPVKNPYPFAQEAYGWILKAAEVLSDPKSKARYDTVRENGGATFWTVCPYCYYMYEYQREYEGCALRCSNGVCKRAFTAEPVAASAVPPPEVADSGKYICGGFRPLGDAEANHGWNWWGPFMFSGLNPGSEKKENGNAREETRAPQSREEETIVIELSDGEEKEKPANGNGTGTGTVVVRMRKKVAAVGAKKLTGKGIRVVWGPSSKVEEEDDDDADDDAAEEDIYVSLKPVVTDMGF